MTPSCSHGRASCVGVFLACAVLGFVEPSLAAGPIGRNGAAIGTSRYAVDLFQGALFAGARVTSLGGAYVAIAWDVDGMLQNPVAPAVRPFFSVTDFDYWLGLGVTFPPSLSDIDFFNSGSKTQIQQSAPNSLVFVTPAAMLQFGPFGVGVSLELQNYGLGTVLLDDGHAGKVSTSFDIGHLQAAYAFDRGALVLGMGSRILAMDVDLSREDSGETVPVRGTGIGIELGALWRPRGQFFSLGLAFRSAISAEATFSDAAILNDAGDVVIATDANDIYLPERVVLPWDLNVGAALELGADPLNGPWVSDRNVAERQELRIRLRMLDREDARNQALSQPSSPEQRAARSASDAALDARDERAIHDVREQAYWTIQERLARAPRGHVVLAGSVLISGAASDAVGIESFLTQTVNRSGQHVVVSPRLGAEMEVIPDWLRIRCGAYVEPTRFETSSARPHYTAGFDIRGPRWSVFGLWPDDYLWRIGVGGDIARNYSTLSFTIAGWYPRHSGAVQRPRAK